MACLSGLTTGVSLLIVVFFGLARSQEEKECSRAADVVFVLDASESIWPYEFTIQTEFVINITRAFYLNETDGVVVGAVVFSSFIGDVIPLKSHLTQSTLEDAIRGFFHMEDGTETNRGLQEMRSLFREGGREGVRKLAIVITDGQSTYTAETLRQSQLARDENITMVAVGVGGNIDFEELQGISSGSQFLFLVQNYVSLRSLVLNMTTTVCPEPPPEPEEKGCEGVSDVFFILDGSESVFDEDFVLEIDFVKDVASKLNINGTDGFIIGALVYSTVVTTEIRMRPALGRSDLKLSLDQAWRIKAGTQTDLGLRRAREIIGQDGRFGVRQVAVIVTDGRSKNTTATALEADRLRESGVDVVAIGVGPLVDDVELYNMASNPELVFFLPGGFDDMKNITGNLTALLCPQADDVVVSTVTPPTTPSYEGACSGCQIVNGVGYNPHPSRCDQYTQCYPAGQGRFRHKFRPCPPGLFWQQSVLTCNRPELVACQHDLCNNSLTDRVPYPGSCGAYWQCREGRSVGARCCERLQSVQLNSCVGDTTCDEDCPLNHSIPPPTPCHLEEHGTDSTKYYMLEWGIRREMTCAQGTVFSFQKCACDVTRVSTPAPPECHPDLYLPFDDFLDHAGGTWVRNEGAQIEQVQGAVGGLAAYFDGTDRVLIPRFSSHDFRTNFLIKLRYKQEGEQQVGSREALVTNADCQLSPSIAVFHDRESQKDGGILSTEHGDYTSQNDHRINQWNEVSYSYDGESLALVTNGIPRDTDAEGGVRVVHAALHIGDGAGFAKFRGYIDELYVYLRCRP